MTHNSALHSQQTIDPKKIIQDNGDDKAIIAALAILQTLSQQPEFQDNKKISGLFSRLLNESSIEQIITLFYRVIKKGFNVEHLEYNNSMQTTKISFGDIAHYNYAYDLMLENQHIGTIHFSSTHPLTHQDEESIYQLSYLLIYPIRNSINYQIAVKSALTDMLTKLGNRASFSQKLNHELEICKRYNKQMSLLLIDIDHFKKVNDAYGHAAGDFILRNVAKKLHQNCRKTDGAFRLGGEEFVVLLRETPIDKAMSTAERLREAIEEMNCIFQNQSIKVTISLGIAGFNYNSTMESLLEHADEALYEAKRTGRNKIITAKIPLTYDDNNNTLQSLV